jgi:mannose-6-phosphate isomerase-like protein (cupin superfamily)
MTTDRNHRRRRLLPLVLLLCPYAGSQSQPWIWTDGTPLAKRIAHTDPALFTRKISHGGSGQMACNVMLTSRALPSNFEFLHRCEVPPHAGIGRHRHTSSEEMYVLLTGEASMSIDGHVSTVRARAGVPLRLGHTHGMLNRSNTVEEFLNINVGLRKDYDDAVDLKDSLEQAKLEPSPPFRVAHFDRSLLTPEEHLHGGAGTAFYRRALDPDDFNTDWAYVDHEALPVGVSDGLHLHRGVDVIAYILHGRGSVRVGSETAPIVTGDAIPIRMGEPHSFTQSGPDELEMLLFGIAKRKGMVDTEVCSDGAPSQHRWGFSELFHRGSREKPCPVIGPPIGQ